MLAIINRYKLFLIIIALVLLAVLIWMIAAGQGEKGDPSRGVFVLSHFRSVL
ncbi:MAG: hypothetical protein ABFD25_04885 [Clostridiaceae bacterium]